MKNIACIYLLFSLVAAAGLSGCNKMISIGTPRNQLVSEAVFTDTATAEAAVLGVYSRVANSIIGSDIGTATSLYNGLSADEGTYFTQGLYDQFTQNALQSSFYYVDFYWTSFYTVIYDANALIAGDSASSLPAGYKARTIGEAKFIRALCYFYLTNEFGAVPLVLSTDVRTTTNQPRDSVSVVYAQIIRDLTDAQSVLPADLTLYAGNRTRATSWAASALLARAYLYQKNWSKAEAAATAVINNPGLFSIVTNPANVFLANSTEGIMQFANAITQSWMATTLAGFPANPTPSFVLSDSLYAAFEPADLRLSNWTGIKAYGGKNYPYPYKYKYRGGVGSVEYAQVLRLSEQYLIRAEARMQQGNLSGAAADVNVVRTRAGLPNTTANDVAAMTAALEHENRIEFFCEWGHRWLDLRRWPGIANPAIRRADEVYPTDKTTSWNPNDALYPIPQAEITTNPNLTQNVGY